ncbi:MAG: 50S ribosomal protein L23 [Verrucomicrobiota bacterium]|jgi:large subunit ribosomal protein L23|nr:50S ribosomal protein L23 [Verrucomicrobiota bacterium]
MNHAGIIRKVQITEKGTLLAYQNRYILEVAPKANKIEIKDAVEKYFGVHVLAVRTQNYKGALRTLKNRRVVRDSNWKRAIVTVKAGERIESVS